MKKALILHGWGQSQSLWKELSDRLESRYKVSSVDFPGFGREPLQADNWGVIEYAEWLNSKVSITDFDVIIAHSFGGRVIVELMSELKTYPPHLILIGTPLVHVTHKGKWYQTTLPIAKKILPQSIQDHLAGKLNKEIPQAKKAGNYPSYKRIISYDQTHQLPNITSKTLLIWGADDSAAPLSIGRVCDKKISESTLKIIPSTGHNVHIEKPLLLYGIIQTFLQTD